MNHYKNIKAIHYLMLEGKYKSRKWDNPVFSYGWDPDLAFAVMVSDKRAYNRINNYIIPGELDRAINRVIGKKDFSLRFGNKKDGNGNFGMRGDFCLLGASYTRKKKGTLTLFYRSLELFGGLVYDQAIINHIQESLGIPLKTIVVMAASCHSFALKGNSNEKLWEKLQVIYEDFD